MVAPKKAALQQAEAEYSTLMEGLAAKKAELGAVVAALDALHDKLAAMQVQLEGCKEAGCCCQDMHVLQWFYLLRSMCCRTIHCCADISTFISKSHRQTLACSEAHAPVTSSLN